MTLTLRGYPNAKQVQVAGSFNFWSRRTHPMVRKGDVWVGEIEAESGRQTYKFIVDDAWITDPANPATEKMGEFTNSVLIVP